MDKTLDKFKRTLESVNPKSVKSGNYFFTQTEEITKKDIEDFVDFVNETAPVLKSSHGVSHSELACFLNGNDNRARALVVFCTTLRNTEDNTKTYRMIAEGVVRLQSSWTEDMYAAKSDIKEKPAKQAEKPKTEKPKQAEKPAEGKAADEGSLKGDGDAFDLAAMLESTKKDVLVAKLKSIESVDKDELKKQDTKKKLVDWVNSLVADKKLSADLLK